MFLTGFADEASHDLAMQIKATKELGWKFIETRFVGEQFFGNISDADFEKCCAMLEESGIRFNCYGSGVANWSKAPRSDEDYRETKAELLRAIPRMKRLGSWEASDLATLRMLRGLGVEDITADWTLFAFNAHALRELSEMGVKRFVASPENSEENLAALAEGGFDVEFLERQSTPLFISLTEPAARPAELSVFKLGRLWVTTKPAPRMFDVPHGASSRVDLSWDPEV